MALNQRGAEFWISWQQLVVKREYGMLHPHSIYKVNPWPGITFNKKSLFWILILLDQYPKVSTITITAISCRQCLPHSALQLKGKHYWKPHCRNGVVDTFEQCQTKCRILAQIASRKKSGNRQFLLTPMCYDGQMLIVLCNASLSLDAWVVITIVPSCA